MKLSEYIQKLQNFMEKNGDLNCFYSSDDEGNEYIKVSFSPSALFTTEPEGYRVDMISQEGLADLDDEDKSEFFKVCVIN
jgi:hypothetical protein